MGMQLRKSSFSFSPLGLDYLPCHCQVSQGLQQWPVRATVVAYTLIYNFSVLHCFCKSKQYRILGRAPLKQSMSLFNGFLRRLPCSYDLITFSLILTLNNRMVVPTMIHVFSRVRPVHPKRKRTNFVFLCLCTSLYLRL